MISFFICLISACSFLPAKQVVQKTCCLIGSCNDVNILEIISVESNFALKKKDLRHAVIQKTHVRFFIEKLSVIMMNQLECNFSDFSC